LVVGVDVHFRTASNATCRCGGHHARMVLAT